jgi:Icc-related predicted phosphoesterase
MASKIQTKARRVAVVVGSDDSVSVFSTLPKARVHVRNLLASSEEIGFEKHQNSQGYVTEWYNTEDGSYAIYEQPLY